MYPKDVLEAVLQLTHCMEEPLGTLHWVTAQDLVWWFEVSPAAAQARLESLAREGLLDDHDSYRWLEPGQYALSPKGVDAIR